MTLEQEIDEDTSIVGTPDDMIAALERLTAATGGFGGFLVLANDWANRERTLNSYELIARFSREVKLLATLSHPNIVRVYEPFELEGSPAYSMEIVTGSSVQELLRDQGELSPGEAVDLQPV